MTPPQQSASSPWRFVPLSEYRAPAAPPSHRIQRGLGGWLARLRRSEPPSVRDDLAPFEAERLERLVPKLPTEPQAEALVAAWRDGGERLLFLVPGDGSWHAAVARAAERLAEQGGRLVEPPAVAPETPLAALLEVVLEAEEPLLLTGLERWYRRHHDGLGAIRVLLSALARRAGPLLLACDCWAWAYLETALAAGSGLPRPMLPAPLDGETLRDWLDPSPTLRLRTTGEPPDETVYRSLAAQTLGLPGVARAQWRELLRRAPDDDGEHGDGESRDGVWLRRPSDLPSVAPLLSREALLILHTLLLHRALDTAELGALLPLDGAALAAQLRILEDAPLVERCEGRLQVVPMPYPQIRRRLADEGYLVGAA